MARFDLSDQDWVVIEPYLAKQGFGCSAGAAARFVSPQITDVMAK